MRELLKQRGRSALLDSRAAVDDNVLAQSGRVDLGALEGDRDARIPPDVLELSLAWIQMRRDQLLALDRNPHAGHLRGAGRADRDQMAERTRANELLRALGKRHRMRVYFDLIRSDREKPQPAV